MRSFHLVRNVLLSWPYASDTAAELLERCPRIQSLGVYQELNDRMRTAIHSLSDLRQLRCRFEDLRVGPLSLLPTYPHLTHLHLFFPGGLDVTSFAAWCPQLPALTHLAVEQYREGGAAQPIPDLLSRMPATATLLVITDSVCTLPPPPPPQDDDPRVVQVCMSPFWDGGQDWQSGIVRGADIWRDAEECAVTKTKRVTCRQYRELERYYDHWTGFNFGFTSTQSSAAPS
jgi:hypothetical protein